MIVDLIGFGVVMPILPFFARDFGASGTELGLLLTAYSAAQFACAPLWGRLSDRVGRRAVMLATIAGTAGSLAMLGLASSLTGLFVARLLAGGFAANVSVASAYVADVTAEEERTRWMGMIGASFGVGFVLGPALGGLLAPFGHHVPMLAAAGLAAANLVYAAFALAEPERHAVSDPTAASLGRFAALRQQGVASLCLIYFAFSIAVTQLETIFAFFMDDRFGWDARRVAFLLVAMAIVMGGIQGGGMRALAARFRERSLIVVGCVVLAVGFAGIPGSPTVAVLLVPLGLAAVGRAVVQPSLLSLVSVAASDETRGLVMGSFQSSASLARVVGPLAAGWLYDRTLSAPFLLACALLFAVALGSRALPRSAVRPSGPR